MGFLFGTDRDDDWRDAPSPVHEGETAMKIYSVQLEHGDDVLFATREQADKYARLSGNGPVSERTIPTVADGKALLDEYRNATEGNVYRIGVYVGDTLVRLYDVTADSEAQAEEAALERAQNLMGVGVSSSEDEPDDTFDATEGETA